jgi:hypothetical protein
LLLLNEPLGRAGADASVGLKSAVPLV